MSHVMVTSLKPRSCYECEWPYKSERKEVPYAAGPQPVVLSARMAIGAVGDPGATNSTLDREEGPLEVVVIL